MRHKNLLKSVTKALSILVPASNAMAANEPVDLRPALYRKFRSTTGVLRVHKRFLEDDGSAVDAGEGRRIARFLNYPDLQPYVEAGHGALGELIRDPRILNALLFLNWSWSSQEQKLNASRLIQLYYTELALTLAESVDDPRLTHNQRSVVRYWLEALERFTSKQNRNAPGLMVGFEHLTAGAERCVQSLPDGPAITIPLPEFRASAIQRLGSLRKCLIDSFPYKLSMPFAELDVRKLIPLHPGSSISKTGFIPGNKVQMLTLNRLANDPEYEQALTAFTQRVIKPYELRWDALTDEAMITDMRARIQKATAEGKNPLEAVFIEDAGGTPSEVVFQNGSVSYTKADTLNIDRNPVWQKYGPPETHHLQIFPQFVNAIRSAESTIFINLFFYGGTMGLSMTDLLLKEMARKPNLKVVLLRDHVNHFGHKPEMRPVFNFLRAYMSLYPKRLIALPADIYEKQVNGLPDFFKSFLNDKFLRSRGLDTQLALYLNAQSDHTKLVVIDGDRPQGHPKAIVGSKNWTDASGALCDDSVILVEGPAAVVALDNYYDDLHRALQRNWQVTSDFWNKFYDQVHAHGWAQSPDCAAPSTQGSQKLRKIAQILCPVDLLKRYQQINSPVHSLAMSRFAPIPARVIGRDLVRLGENNAAATITSINNQNVQAILNAKKQILIHEQLLYSPSIVDSLVSVAKKGVSVKIILESFVHDGEPYRGIPNMLFLAELQKAGAEVKWRIHGHTRQFVPEHHGKTISIDGWTAQGQRVTDSIPTLIVGSANKDLLTMKGGFRELQVETFSESAARDHDAYFWTLWHDSKESRPATFAELESSELGQKIRNQGLTPAQFMKYLSQFIISLYSMKPISR